MVLKEADVMQAMCATAVDEEAAVPDGASEEVGVAPVVAAPQVIDWDESSEDEG